MLQNFGRTFTAMRMTCHLLGVPGELGVGSDMDLLRVLDATVRVLADEVQLHSSRADLALRDST